jgi:hypothetical protein
MGTVRDLGLLMLGVGVGASCFSRGAQKLFGWFGGGVQETAEAMSAMGLFNRPWMRGARPGGALAAAMYVVSSRSSPEVAEIDGSEE